ncbi:MULTISPECIES: hypothetical protein [unclassified Micromonospora]|uniref:hypothetical protein n=1 Tax=unclassified Micromonospora TaxID=2617518 RepID=UPI001B36C9A0|nr:MULTISPECIES: hypothetical protein [unclassified Micromonospora]MBQ1041365.1 hypothetical protein [Micromonospora sp. C72]MBQ1054835.1 hypothetical protein [Micromonospora sp. C32]
MQFSIDRDSVCMGDDVDSHRVTFHVRPHRTLGSLLAQALRKYRLASVGGEISWIAEVTYGGYRSDERGSLHSPTTHALALLHVPFPEGETTIIPLSNYFLSMPLREMAERAGGAEVTLNFHYLSEGARWRPEEFIARYK